MKLQCGTRDKIENDEISLTHRMSQRLQYERREQEENILSDN
jgi:hypothetical protein